MIDTPAYFINEKLNQLVTVDIDPDPESPFQEIKDAGLPFRYYIDNLNSNDVQNDLAHEVFNDNPDAYENLKQSCHSSEELFKRIKPLAKQQHKLVLPITKYEHGYIEYSLGITQGWDYGACGFVVADLNDETIKDQSEDEIIGQFIDFELACINDYVNGEILLITTQKLDDFGHVIDTSNEYDTRYGHEIEDLDDLYNESLLDSQRQDWKPARQQTTISYHPVN